MAGTGETWSGAVWDGGQGGVWLDLVCSGETGRLWRGAQRYDAMRHGWLRCSKARRSWLGMIGRGGSRLDSVWRATAGQRKGVLRGALSIHSAVLDSTATNHSIGTWSAFASFRIASTLPGFLPASISAK